MISSIDELICFCTDCRYATSGINVHKTAILEAMSLLAANNKREIMNWFKKKEICTHCNNNKTKREFENQPTCAECKTKILTGREPTRICPIDGSILLKVHSNEIIIDRCPKCKGVWLDAGEIEAIKKAAQTEGLAIGMVF